MSKPQLPGKVIAYYALGMMGWSILNNIIAVMINYFYLPPADSGLHELLPNAPILVLFNVLSLILMGSRLSDAIFDPWIAHRSDVSTNKAGRRIPFLRWFALPATVFCALVFLPPGDTPGVQNIVWLAVMVVGYFLCATAYVIPYNALLPELARDPESKLRLSSFQSLGFVAGIIISSTVPALANALEALAGERALAVQLAIWLLAAIGGICMIVPAFTINEKDFSVSHPAHEPFWPALREALRNRNFVIFIAADFAYYMAVAIIVSSLMFYVTVLLGLPEAMGPLVMGVMVLVSLVYYIFIRKLVNRFGKKKLVVFSFFLMVLIFSGIYFYGRYASGTAQGLASMLIEHPEAHSGTSLLQLLALGIFFSLPLALLGILPNAIIAEIATASAEKTGEYKEGMYFAVRYMFVKLGQTAGYALSASLLLLGKDVGDDLGIRLTGICGAVLCLLAGLIFLKYREQH